MAPLAMAVLVLCCSVHVRSDGSDHRYKEGEDVPLYANKVGPFHNPSETYRYFDLPFCSSDTVKEKREALGEVLNGVTGGFNFQNAWSGGYIAGTSIGELAADACLIEDVIRHKPSNITY